MIELSFLCRFISPGKSYYLPQFMLNRNTPRDVIVNAVHNVSPCVSMRPVEVINRTNKLTSIKQHFNTN